MNRRKMSDAVMIVAIWMFSFIIAYAVYLKIKRLLN